MQKKYIYLAFIAAIFFIPFLGLVHLLDWDEANFAELAREMIVSGDYLQPQINFMPFYEKPPLFIWLQVISMKLFGINEFAARFPNAVAGIVVLCALFYIGKKHYSERMAWLWVLSMGASIAPHFYFKTGLIDPIFNFFIFLSIYFFGYLWISDAKKWRYSLLSGLFAGLAVMTKGPVALILIAGSLGLGWILLKFKSWRSIGYLVPWTIIMLGVSSIWFLYITQKYGDTYVKEFITYQIRLFQTEDAKHGGTLLFHPIALLLGCFPASIFMWSAFQKSVKNTSEFQSTFFKLMLSCGIIVLVVFSLVQTKIIHYSSMDYYPITFFAALGFNHLIDTSSKLKKWQIGVLILLGFLWATALTITPYLGQNLDKIKPFIHDANFLEQLKTPIQWDLWACGLGLVFAMVYFYGIHLLSKDRLHKGFVVICIAILFCIQVVSLYHLPRIEKMVQGSLVEFCESLNSRDVNTQALYVKSYNQYFYSNRQPYKNVEDTLKHLHYLYRPIEKDCYFILRSIDRIHMDTSKSPNAKELLSKNGFIFYLRKR